MGLVLVMVLNPVAALDPGKELTQYTFSSWYSDSGLPQNSVRNITQGPHGYLWVGTYEGVVLFDGLGFKRFVQRSGPRFQKTINALFTDREGTVWVASEGGGLYAVSPEMDVRQWAIGHGLPSSQVTAIVDGGTDGPWFAAARQVYRIHDGAAERIARLPPFEFRIRSLYRSKSGMLWVGTTGGGLYSWFNGELRHYSSAQGFFSNRVTSIIGDGGEGLWIGSFAGVEHYTNGRFEPLERPANRGVERIQNLWLEKNGVLWIGTYGGGLERWAKDRFSVFSSSQGLRNDYIQSLYLDAQGNLWFGTSEGLNRLRDGSVLTYSTSEGLQGRFARSVAKDRAGDMWVGMDGGGLNRIHEGRVDLIFGVDDGLLSDNIRALLPDGSGGLWVGAFGGGVNRMRNAKIEPGGLPGGPPSILVRSLFVDRAGALWVGTNDAGVGRYFQDRRQLFTTSNGLPTNDVRAITEFAGRIWLGTYGGGIVVLDAGRVEKTYGVADGLPSADVFTFFSDTQSLLWAGTTDGLAVFKSGRWQALPSANVARSVFHILKDDAGFFWLCTNSGIMRVSVADLLASAGASGPGPRVRIFGELDGMRSGQCNGATQPVASADAQGRLWFPTLDGVAVIDPYGIKTNAVPPLVHVDSLAVGDEKYFHFDGQNLALRAGTQDLDIRYNGLDISMPERVRFRYRLIGLSDAWSPVSARRRAFFTNLSPGAYEFQVLAANGDGVWTRNPARMSFFITPYFYQTGWFLVALALLVALGLYAIYRWRVGSLNRAREMLEQRVNERTGELQSANQQLQGTLRKLRQSQDELVRSEKLASLGKLVAGVAHHLNTPIGNCTTVGTLLQDEYQRVRAAMDEGAISRNQFRRFVEKGNAGFDLLCTNLELAGKLVGKFRKLSVADYTAASTPFDLSRLLAELSGMFGARIQQAGHEWRMSCPDGLWVLGSRKALAEVLEQLVDNALTHAFEEPGGKVCLEIQNQSKFVELRFRDNGVGISAERAEQVFEPFAGRVHGSVGLGLPIVHNRVTVLMGGEVACESGALGGVCFVIRVPSAVGDPSSGNG